MVNKLNKFEYTLIGYLLIAHLLTNLLFFILNLVKIKPEEEPEEEPEVLLAKKTELTIHCIISAVMLGLILVARLGIKDLDFFKIAMWVHLGVCVVVGIVANARPESVTWLSWVFEIVSTGVLVIGAAMHYYSGSKLMKQFANIKKMVPDSSATQATADALQKGIDRALVAQEAAKTQVGAAKQVAAGAAATQVVAAQEAAKQAANVKQNPLNKFGKFLNFGKRKLK